MPRRKAGVEVSASVQDEAQGLVNAINSRFGEGLITFASDPAMKVTRWPTGIVPIDHILDGGIARGRMIELHGAYSTLKSYVLYRALGACQQAGGKVGLVDTEHSFDPDWAIKLGLDPSKLLISRPDTAEQGIGVLETLVRQRYDMLGFDSIAAAQPKQYAESAPGDDNQPGALARVMSKGLARVNAANKGTSVIFINQVRNKIGVTFGSPQTTSGGLAMGYYASHRLSFTRIGKVTEDFQRWNGEKMVTAKKTIAHQIQCVLEKSKLSAPYADAVFTYDLTTGQVDDYGYVIGLALQQGVVVRTPKGHWSIPGHLDTPVFGKRRFDEWLDQHDDVMDWITGEVLK